MMKIRRTRFSDLLTADVDYPFVSCNTSVSRFSIIRPCNLRHAHTQDAHGEDTPVYSHLDYCTAHCTKSITAQ